MNLEYKPCFGTKCEHQGIVSTGKINTITYFQQPPSENYWKWKGSNCKDITHHKINVFKKLFIGSNKKL